MARTTGTNGRSWCIWREEHLDGNGVTDLDEMKKVGSNDEINLIVQFDRAGARQETKRFFYEKAQPWRKTPS